ncbi:MAG: hypothetical protein DSM107014_00480 [Gomphosphaeria aponina SAG 52.96 = DSM 107014]|uniref:Uncharacterized protein n=1 Tax=Gomphosphaeria aponina SAG 52.96 = DSM 107014 TaxID=1521640 RepID=A0A941JR52_9CHRO|nr:hypothetical protein [Gomphosphaeria aponina SAG 52.96 = DSM 107014]
MAAITIATRNQTGNALTSLGGIPFVTILPQGERLIDEQTVDLIYADAYFDNLTPGKYTAMVRHELVQPALTLYDFEIMTDSELTSILFNYLEPERVLLNIRTILAME